MGYSRTPGSTGGGAGVTDGDKGDITVSASGATYTVDNDAITYAKIQNVSATSRLLGRITAGAGDVEEVTAAQARTLLNVADGATAYTDEAAQDAIAAFLVAGSNITLTHNDGANTLTVDAAGGGGGLDAEGAQDAVGAMVADTATIDVTYTDATPELKWDVKDNSVTYAKLQDVSATSRFLGRVTAGAGDAEELTGADARTIAGLATTDTPQFVGVEVGHASDTTLTRASAGQLAVEGVQLSNASNVLTLTNKRVTPRTGTTTSSATPTINTDNVDFYSLTAQTADITSFTTNLSGTPTDGQKLWIAITGTAARAITWGASFESSTVTLPTTTVSTNRLDVGFIWNAATSKFRCVAVA